MTLYETSKGAQSLHLNLRFKKARAQIESKIELTKIASVKVRNFKSVYFC